MSFGSVGATGTPDDSGLSQWDSGSYSYILEGSQAMPPPTIPFDTQQFGYVSIRAVASDQAYNITVRWQGTSSNPAAVDSRVFTVEPTGGAPLSIVTPNRWSDADVTVAAAAYPFTSAVYVTTTNRALPGGSGQSAPSLLYATPNLTAGATATSYLTQVYGGQVRSHIFGGSQGVSVQYQYMATNFTWREVQVVTVAANALNDANIFLPLAPVRVNVTNSSGVNANATATILAFPIQASG